MSKEPTISQTANKIVEIAEGVRAVQGVVPRALHDMPDLVHHKGAKEVAVLTVAVREQAFTFKPVMEALQVLSAGDVDWSKPFLVAHELAGAFGGPSFDWKKAPDRSYASFEDFYRRELEATWGEWEQLQHTYAQIVRGEITEDQGRKIVLRNRGGQPDNKNASKNESGNTVRDATFDLRSNEKNSKAHIQARLELDRPDLAVLVRTKQMSANAAAIEAGYRKKPKSKKRPRTELEIARIGKMTKSERRVIWEFLRKEFGR
jgi:hypothetical protein